MHAPAENFQTRYPKHTYFFFWPNDRFPANVFFFILNFVSLSRLLHILSALQNAFTMEANTMNTDQTAPKGAVWSESILFV